MLMFLDVSFAIIFSKQYRALDHAITEPQIKAMIDARDGLFRTARVEFVRNYMSSFCKKGIKKTLGPLKGLLVDKSAADPVQYGITFISENFLRAHYGQ